MHTDNKRLKVKITESAFSSLLNDIKKEITKSIKTSDVSEQSLPQLVKLVNLKQHLTDQWFHEAKQLNAYRTPRQIPDD